MFTLMLTTLLIVVMLTKSKITNAGFLYILSTVGDIVVLWMFRDVVIAWLMQVLLEAG